jgi:serine protease Do
MRNSLSLRRIMSIAPIVAALTGAGGCGRAAEPGPRGEAAQVAEAARPSIVRVIGLGGMAQSTGSGFFIRGDQGDLFVVSNDHVVWGAANIDIELADGTVLPVAVVGSDPAIDLVVLRPTPGLEVPPLSFADDSHLRPGDGVLSMASLPGLAGVVSVGVLSGRGKVAEATLPGERSVDYLYTDAVMSAGTSGGPLLDTTGRVIGINVAVVGGGRGLGIAIPSHLAQRVVGAIEHGGRFEHSFAGLRVVDERPGAPEPACARVTFVNPAGPADLGQVRVGDSILAINDEVVHGASDVLWREFMDGPGARWKIEVLRQTQRLSLAVVLQVFPQGN